MSSTDIYPVVLACTKDYKYANYTMKSFGAISKDGKALRIQDYNTEEMDVLFAGYTINAEEVNCGTLYAFLMNEFTDMNDCLIENEYSLPFILYAVESYLIEAYQIGSCYVLRFYELDSKEFKFGVYVSYDSVLHVPITYSSYSAAIAWTINKFVKCPANQKVAALALCCVAAVYPQAGIKDEPYFDFSNMIFDYENSISYCKDFNNLVDTCEVESTDKSVWFRHDYDEITKSKAIGEIKELSHKLCTTVTGVTYANDGYRCFGMFSKYSFEIIKTSICVTIKLCINERFVITLNFRTRTKEESSDDNRNNILANMLNAFRV